MNPPAGWFRHRVEILRPVETQSASGFVSRTYELQESRWADAVPKASLEYERSAQAVEEAQAVYRIRGRIEVTLRHRLRHLGQTYEIARIETDGNKPTTMADLIVLTVKGPV